MINLISCILKNDNLLNKIIIPTIFEYKNYLDWFSLFFFANKIISLSLIYTMFNLVVCFIFKMILGFSGY